MTINQCDNSSGGQSTNYPVNQSIMDYHEQPDYVRVCVCVCLLAMLVVRALGQNRAAINNDEQQAACVCGRSCISAVLSTIICAPSSAVVLTHTDI